MNAEEAKKLSNKMPAKREAIDNAIREAALNGNTHTSYYADEFESVCEELKVSLEADGFYVSLDYEEPESHWSSTGKGRFYISW